MAFEPERSNRTKHLKRSDRVQFDEGFAERLCRELSSSGLVDSSAIGRARRATEVSSERLDHAFVRLGLVPEAQAC